MATTIGFTQCLNCDARVEARENVHGKVYYDCNGGADPGRRACGARVQLGKLDSAKIKNHIESESANVVKNRPDDEPGKTDRQSTGEPEPERGNAPSPPPGKPAKSGKDGGLLAGIFE